jgi:hypothetical protein
MPEHPPELQPFMKRFAVDHPELAKCGFVIMRFEETDSHRAILKAIEDTCQLHGLTARRADYKRYSDDLFPNIKTYMHSCSFGVAIFDRISRNYFNPNVSLEVGYMMALNKPVCLLRDQNLRQLQSDLVGRFYETFNPQWAVATIRTALVRWLKDKELIAGRTPMENKILNTLFVEQVKQSPTIGITWFFQIEWSGPTYDEFLRAKGKLLADGLIKEGEKNLFAITTKGFHYSIDHYFELKGAGRWCEETVIDQEVMQKVLNREIGPTD